MKLSCASLQNAAGRLISVKVAVQLPTDSKINKLSFVLYLKHKNHFWGYDPQQFLHLYICCDLYLGWLVLDLEP